MEYTMRQEERYPKHRQDFEEAVLTAIECARTAQEERGYFDFAAPFGGQGTGYVFAASLRGHETYTVLTGLGSEIPETAEGAEAHIRRLDRMEKDDTLTYLGSVGVNGYAGRDAFGEEAEYRLIESRQLQKIETTGE